IRRYASAESAVRAGSMPGSESMTCAAPARGMSRKQIRAARWLPRTSQHELAEEPRGHAGRSLDPRRVLAVAVRGARNVEVRPGIAVHELAQKPAGRDASRRSAAAVLHVGDVGLDEVVVVIPERQLPDPLVGP